MKKRRNPNVFTLPKVYRFNREAEINLQLIPHQELESLRTGNGSEQSFHTLAARLNVGLVCFQRYWKDDLENIKSMDDALNALVAVRNRFERTGKWGVSGDELKNIGTGLNLTDEAQLNLTRRDFGAAMEYVLKVASY